MKALLVEDQPMIRQELMEMIDMHCPGVEMTGSAGSVVEGARMAREHRPELLFLDIELPDGTGFDLLDIIDIPVRVIFITGSDAYAIRAFRYAAIDYLLKPVDPQELKDAVQRIHADHARTERMQLEIYHAVKSTGQGRPDRIALHTSDKIHFIEIPSIIRCEADGNYTRFFLHNLGPLLVARTLKDYDQLLGDADFVRVHQSHLVNMMAVKEYVKQDGGYLVMSDGARIPVSTRKKAEVLERFNQMPHA